MDKMQQAGDFLNIIRALIREEQNKHDRVEICQIDSVNKDDTVNIKMLSDIDTINVIPNIANQSIYNFQEGDFAVVYMIKNQLSNAFIIAKCAPNKSGIRFNSGVSNGETTIIQNVVSSGGGGSSGATINNGKMLDAENNQIFSANQYYDVVISDIDGGTSQDVM